MRSCRRCPAVFREVMPGRVRFSPVGDRAQAGGSRLAAGRKAIPLFGALFAVLTATAGVEAAQPAQQPRPLPESIRLEADIPYADTDNPRQQLDLLLPKEPAGDGPLPVVAFIHGGAWRGGDKRGGRGQLAPLVASGKFAGVSIGYRLTNEATWPAQIHDCKAAIRWIRGNAKKYNLDPNKIAVWGSSAGGHLVAMLGTSGGVKELEGTLGKHTDQDSRVTCVVNFFGPTDFSVIGDFPSQIDHYAANSPESLLVGGPIKENPEKARSASPVTFVSADDPPFLTIHGTKDQLVPFDQGKRLHEALKKAGVSSILIPVEEGGHGFRSREVPQRVRAFLGKHLLGEEAAVSEEPIREQPAPQPAGANR